MSPGLTLLSASSKARLGPAIMASAVYVFPDRLPSYGSSSKCLFNSICEGLLGVNRRQLYTRTCKQICKLSRTLNALKSMHKATGEQSQGVRYTAKAFVACDVSRQHLQAVACGWQNCLLCSSA